MKAQNMSEPISGAAAGVAGWKAISSLAAMGAIGAGLAAFVVMSMSKPSTDREWRVALACTFVGSIGGGAALIMYLGIQQWADSAIGLVGMGGLIFACGLPAWAIVRALFLYLDHHKGDDLAEIVKDVRGSL